MPSQHAYSAGFPNIKSFNQSINQQIHFMDVLMPTFKGNIIKVPFNK